MAFRSSSLAGVRLRIAKYHRPLASAAIVAATGLVLTSLSGAASYATTSEAESGSVSRSGMVVDDSSASGGKAVRFTTASTTPGNIDFISFGPDMYNFVGGSQKSIDGITLRLTTGGDFQVVNSSGAILWRTNTSANCSTTANCRVVLQNDGNLVLYGPSGVLWSSETWNTSGATVLFQPREPYLAMRNGNYEVVWTSGGSAANASIGMMTGALKAPTAPSVKSFLDSLAVNSHMDQYEGDAARVYDKLNYLGIRHIRDHWNEDGSLSNQYNYLAQRNIKFNMIHYSSNFDILIRDATLMANLPNNPLIAVEGPNEINNFPFTCSGSTWAGGWPNDNGPAAQCYQEGYYSRFRANSRFNGIPMYHLTGGPSARDSDKYGLLSLDKQADLGNIHPYPHPNNQPYNHYLRELGSTYYSVPPNKAVITETGYQTSQVSQRAQALYYMNLYLTAFQQGIKKTYIYELTDNSTETHGMFDTSNNPKQSATALHNMTTILADTGTSGEGTLNYSITGAPKEAHSFALQRSNGSYNLIIWDERQIWNGADVTPAAANITASFGRSFSSVKVFKPKGGTSAISTFNNASSTSLQLNGEPIILELTP